METKGETYSYYFIMEYWPHFFLLALWALTLLLIPVQLMLNRSPKVKCHCITQFLIENVFSILLKKHTDRAGKGVYTISNYKAPDRYKFLMLAIALTLIGIVWIMFWDHFLLEKSHNCSTDPDLACFPAYPNISTPRLDCSDTSYLEDNNITSVICFRLVYRLGIATGSAVGIVTTTTMVIAIITSVLLKASNGSGWNKYRAVLTVAIQITIVAITVGIAIAIYLFHTSTSLAAVEKQITRVVRDTSVTYTVIYITVLFPWWSFEQINDNENENNNKDNNDEQDVTTRMGILSTI